METQLCTGGRAAADGSTIGLGDTDDRKCGGCRQLEDGQLPIMAIATERARTEDSLMIRMLHQRCAASEAR